MYKNYGLSDLLDLLNYFKGCNKDLSKHQSTFYIYLTDEPTCYTSEISPNEPEWSELKALLLKHNMRHKQAIIKCISEQIKSVLADDLTKPININTRINNALSKQGIHIINDLLTFPKDHYIRGIGKKSKQLIEEYLKCYKTF